MELKVTLKLQGYKNRINCYNKLSKFDEAIDDYHKIIEIDKNNSETYLILG
jgi:hypothetical protein